LRRRPSGPPHLDPAPRSPPPRRCSFPARPLRPAPCARDTATRARARLGWHRGAAAASRPSPAHVASCPRRPRPRSGMPPPQRPAPGLQGAAPVATRRAEPRCPSPPRRRCSPPLLASMAMRMGTGALLPSRSARAPAAAGALSRLPSPISARCCRRPPRCTTRRPFHTSSWACSRSRRRDWAASRRRSVAVATRLCSDETHTPAPLDSTRVHAAPHCFFVASPRACAQLVSAAACASSCTRTGHPLSPAQVPSHSLSRVRFPHIHVHFAILFQNLSCMSWQPTGRSSCVGVPFHDARAARSRIVTGRGQQHMIISSGVHHASK
jgi:hypothetical protein